MSGLLDALEAIAESGIATGAICISYESDAAVDLAYSQLGEPKGVDRSEIQRPTFEGNHGGTDGRAGYRRVARTTILGLRVVLQGPLRLGASRRAA